MILSCMIVHVQVATFYMFTRSLLLSKNTQTPKLQVAKLQLNVFDRLS